MSSDDAGQRKPTMTAWKIIAGLDLSYWLSSNCVAVVRCADRVSIIRDPGDRDDDALRALVAAPELSTVQRFRQEPAGPDLMLLTWPCMVCGVDRFDAQISVARRPSGIPLAPVIYVRYCNDRPNCVAVATATTVWPPTRSDRCIPARNVHADPHTEDRVR